MVDRPVVQADAGSLPSELESGIVSNETTTPILPCVSVEAMRGFYESLGFRTTYAQQRPYLYLAVAWSGFELHFRKAPQGMDPANEDGGAAIVSVDAVAPYHAAFVAAMREVHGRILTKGLPRITRLRPGASRFTLYDPSGNSIIFIQRDEPGEVEYGGSSALVGLAKALDNARIYREFKTDDRAAFRHLRSALRKHRDNAPPVDRALALATLMSLAVALEDTQEIPALRHELAGISLTPAEQQRLDAALRDVEEARAFEQAPE
jgi:hypothetical protein